jgi:polyadenylate-binding protein
MSTQVVKPPSASLYVGDLKQEVSEGMLFDIFNPVGPVSSIRVCRDTLTRRSLGYAYVNFHNEKDADKALHTLNNHPIHGKPCRIMWSQRDPSIRKSGAGNIFIKNLDPSIGHNELYDTFSQFGNILSCKVAMDEHGKSKGYGFVHFEREDVAEKAIKTVDGKKIGLGEKEVFVGPFIPRKVRSQQLENSWTNVYVKDIDSSVTQEEFEKKFSEFGEVTSAVIMTGDDESSKGFGFVNFLEHESAVKAVEAMNGSQLGGKTLWCGRAQKKAERERELKKQFEQMKIHKYQGINLYIKNIEDDIDEERLRKEFSAFGQIRSCKIMTDDKGNSKGFGFVCFSAPEESQRAITEMNNRILQGCQKPLYVALHEPKELRRQKLAQRHNLNKNRMNVAPTASGGVYGGPTPIYYPPNSNVQPNFVAYPQQMIPPMARGWPPSYQAVPPNYTMVPNPALPRNSAGGGRGRGTTGGAASRGGGRGMGRRNNQPQAVPTTQVPAEGVVNPMEITLSQLSQFPPEQQKLLIGERLYPLIAKGQPALAGKITGMFLDPESGWSIEELFSLINDEEKLHTKIEDAIGVLERAKISETQNQPETPQEQPVEGK